jgi:hypothetical protein
VCEDGFYLLKKSENRISMPVGIALGVIGGIILALLGTCELSVIEAINVWETRGCTRVRWTRLS